MFITFVADSLISGNFQPEFGQHVEFEAEQLLCLDGKTRHMATRRRHSRLSRAARPLRRNPRRRKLSVAEANRLDYLIHAGDRSLQAFANEYLAKYPETKLGSIERHIQRVLARKSPLTPRKATAIADTLGLSVDDFWRKVKSPGREPLEQVSNSASIPSSLVCSEQPEESIREQTTIVTGSREKFIRPFRPVRKKVSLFGRSGSLSEFCPTLEEYLEQSVHRPTLADRVERELSTNRFACVQGEGAAGKTTLAILIALGPKFGGHQSFYLDLADLMDNADMQEKSLQALAYIGSQYEREVLVIVDNIHLEEECAHELHSWHSEHDRPVCLLMLGRRIVERGNLRGRDEPLANIIRDAQMLQVEGGDLSGVFQRLARRATPKAAAPIPPDMILNEWRSLFGGDLFAFSHAVKRKLELQREGWKISEQDANDYVWREYLEDLKPEEREGLFTLAWCQHLELVLPTRCLAQPGIFRTSQKSGLVWYVETIRGYRFCHPGMARLITEIEDCPKNDIDTYARLARDDLRFGFAAASRLLKRKRDRNAAYQVLKAATDSSDVFDKLLKMNLASMRSHCNLLTDLGIFQISDIDRRLSQCASLSHAVIAAPVSSLVGFLRYALTPSTLDISLYGSSMANEAQLGQRPNPRMPKVVTALDRALAKPENLTQLKQVISRPSVLRLLARKLNSAMPIICARREYLDGVAEVIAFEFQKSVKKNGSITKGLDVYINCEPDKTRSVSLALLHLRTHSQQHEADCILWKFPVILAKHWMWTAQKYHAEQESVNILRFLGAGSLFDLQLTIFKSWPPYIRDNLLKITRQDLRSRHIGSTVLVWIGIREMAKNCEEQLSIPKQVGQRILKLWRGLDANLSTLENGMITWLEQCATCNWLLIKDNTVRSPFCRRSYSSKVDQSWHPIEWYPTELYEPQAGD